MQQHVASTCVVVFTFLLLGPNTKKTLVMGNNIKQQKLETSAYVCNLAHMCM